jgi:hypothetical protein
MKYFLSELKAIVGPGVLARVVQDARERPAGTRAGQLTCFFLRFFFLFLIFLVALAGLVLNDPQSANRGLISKSAPP